MSQILLLPASKPVYVGDALSGSQASTALVAQTTYLLAFKVDVPTTITVLRFRTAATVTSTGDIGLYDYGQTTAGTCTRLVHQGATTLVASTVTNYTIPGGGQLCVPGGYYFLALWYNAADTAFVEAITGTLTPTMKVTATNAGGLPASFATNAFTSNTFKIGMVGLVSGSPMA